MSFERNIIKGLAVLLVTGLYFLLLIWGISWLFGEPSYKPQPLSGGYWLHQIGAKNYFILKGSVDTAAEAVHEATELAWNDSFIVAKRVQPYDDWERFYLLDLRARQGRRYVFRSEEELAAQRRALGVPDSLPYKICECCRNSWPAGARR